MGSLLERFRQYCIGSNRLSHGKEVELNQIGNFVSHNNPFLALDRLLDPHLSSAKYPMAFGVTYLERSTQTFKVLIKDLSDQCLILFPLLRPL